MDTERKFRKLLGLYDWSVSKLARRAGVKQQAVDRLVKRAPVAVSRGAALAKALGVPADWLFSEADWPPPMPLARSVGIQNHPMIQAALETKESPEPQPQSPAKVPKGPVPDP